MTEDRPPVLKSWRNVYVLIVAVLLSEIGIMYWITSTFQ